MNINPVIATVTRGTITESLHRGAFAVGDGEGKLLLSAGDIDAPVYPRSAIKAFQCLPLIESGAAQHFAFSDEEIALCCSSHNGEPEHLRVARSILAKSGTAPEQLECGAHWPSGVAAARDLARTGLAPQAIHNNCSGKHAGMLALARHLGVDPSGYVKQSHAVQIEVAKTLARYCDIDVDAAPVGIDGCSVPTWAFPLRNMAMGFARLTEPGFAAGEWIIRAARGHPFTIAGSKRFDTDIMNQIPRLFIKVGAEGVFCGAVPHAQLGFALKCDDGAGRAAEAAIAGALLKIDVWSADERNALQGFANVTLKNWRGLEVGTIAASV